MNRIWAIADQAISSAITLGLGIIVARSVGLASFGVFALVLSSYYIALGTSRALSSEPLIVRHSVASNGRPHSAAAGTAAAAGFVLGGVAILATCMLPGEIARPFQALAIALPGLLLHDFWRYSCFARERGHIAVGLELLWGALALGSAAAISAVGVASVAPYILVWGAAGGLASVAGILLLSVRPSLLLVRRWLRGQWDLAPRFMLEFLAVSGAGQVAVYLVGAIGGLADVGALRAAQVLAGPLNVLFMGFSLVAVAESVRTLGLGRHRLLRHAVAVSTMLGGVAVLWGIAAHFIPGSLGRTVLGASWDAAHDVFLIFALALAGTGFGTGAFIGLRALEAARRTLVTRALLAPIIIASSAVGAATAGAVGAATGFALSNFLAAVVLWWHFLSALSDHARASSSPVLPTHPAV